MFNSTQAHGGQLFLDLRRMPARLTAAETAAVLGFSEHDVGPLIAARLLTPLGRPAANAPKLFAAVEITALAEDKGWLDKATRAMAAHWRSKNARKSVGVGENL
jgi:hypothetical protein